MPSIVINGQIQIKGSVTDINLEPLAGVNVIIKDTQEGVVTDINGKYSIMVPDENSILVFSYITYKTVEEKVGERRIINVILEEDIKQLEEIVVVGYGVVKKSDLTSSISSVKGTDVQSMTVGNINQSLQGKVPGLQIIGSGAPGAQPKVLVRGFSTINLSTDPLYVVDGIPIGGGINFLSPNEIESIEVLKDASASAIYGSRASNGVIMVTTKRGKEGNIAYNLNLSYGLQSMNRPYNMADAVEYAEIMNFAALNAGYPKVFEDPQEYEGKTTDWWHAGIKETSPQMNLSFGFSGGNEKNVYSANITYYQQKSFYEKGGYVRFTSRFTDDFKFSKIFSGGITLNPRFESWGNPGNWQDFIRIDPITPIYKPADQLTGDENEYSIYARSPSYVWNPVATVKRWNQKNRSYALSTTAYLQIQPISEIVFRSQVGFELDSRISDAFYPDFVIDAAHEFQTYNRVERSQPMYRNWSLQNTITYLKTINNKHNVTAMLGNTLEEWNGTSLWGTKEKIPNNNEELRELDAGTLNPKTGGSAYTNSVMSYFGRIMYNLNNRYYLTATYRVDGSSKFLKKNKWASFPSISLAWRISEENFMSGTKDVINDLKVRIGAGQVGNQNLPAAVYMSKLGQGYYVFDDNIVNTTYPSAIKNEDIKWETVEDKNIGIDFNLLQGKLSGSLEYYVKNTDNMLFMKAYPNYSGYPNDAKIWTNIGSMKTKGVDANLSYSEKVNDFYFNADVTFTTFNVKMSSLGGNKEPLYGNNERTITIEGDEPGYFYGYVADGIFQNQTEINSHTSEHGIFLQPYAKVGDIRFKDINNDGVLNANDRTKIGSPWADFTMGINLNFAYKNIDVLTNFYCSFGNDLVDQNKNELHNCIDKTNKIAGLTNLAWHGEGTSNDIPKISAIDNNENFSKFSSFYIEDGSFIRLKNLQIGYTFNQLFNIPKVRLYLAGQNILTLTKYNGIDPEVGGGVLGFGFGGWDYPIQPTFLIGTNITF